MNIDKDDKEREASNPCKLIIIRVKRFRVIFNNMNIQAIYLFLYENLKIV